MKYIIVVFVLLIYPVQNSRAEIVLKDVADKVMAMGPIAGMSGPVGGSMCEYRRTGDPWLYSIRVVMAVAGMVDTPAAYVLNTWNELVYMHLEFQGWRCFQGLCVEGYKFTETTHYVYDGDQVIVLISRKVDPVVRGMCILYPRPSFGTFAGERCNNGTWCDGYADGLFGNIIFGI